MASYADMWYEILNFISPGFMEAELMSADCPVMEVINYISEDHRGRRCGVREGIEYARFYAAHYLGAVRKIIEKKRSL